MSFLTKSKYSRARNWDTFKSDCDDELNFKKLYDLHVDESWRSLFDDLLEDQRMNNIKEKLNKSIADDESIFPKPDYVFNAFKLTPLHEIKVLISGQDPYHNTEIYHKRDVPQAMGLSFSVPLGFEVPSSLKNIYSNIVKFGNMQSKPDHGNLEFWAYQGCFMINSALTVTKGNPNVHSNEWRWFTNKVIHHVSTNSQYCVFVLWGKDAKDKLSLIDLDKHDAIITSHPSGLSASKSLGHYPSFNDFDHFGTINKYLIKNKLEPIIWRL